MAFPIALTGGGGSKCSPIVSFRQGKASGGEIAVAYALTREAAEGALVVFGGSRHREAGISLGAAACLRCEEASFLWMFQESANRERKGCY